MSILKKGRLIPVSGGDINEAYRLETGRDVFFVKKNKAELENMFRVEAEALEELHDCGIVRVPKVIEVGATEAYSYLILEYLRLRSLDAGALRRFGEQLARLHSIRQPYFGWKRNNTIGSTPQLNVPSDDWSAFWRRQRLHPQLQLLKEKGFDAELIDKGLLLAEKTELFFAGYRPQPSLLHGDLWSGNAAATESGEPVFYDPATYYGDREADIAMTQLFGGFGTGFYEAYQGTYGLDAGFDVRREMYNLYHILNHANLFGGGYARQAERMIDFLLAQV